MSGSLSGPATALLSLPAAVYGAAVRIRNAWFDRANAPRAAALPVISVGNLAVGGTGKTPLVAWIAARLLAAGQRPAIVSRGYRGTAGSGPLLVSTGSGPRVDARACGDEPFLLARRLPGVVVIVGADRIEGVRAAAAAGATVAVLDDAFQHRRIARNLDLVVLDARAPFGNGRLLPAGILREPPASLARADLVVLTRLDADDRADSSVAAVRAAGFSGPVVRAGHRLAGFFDEGGRPAGTPAEAFGFCGIGDPELFRSDLARAAVRLSGFESFPDHHAYTRATWERLVARAGSVPLVTTEKDLARLAALAGRADAPHGLLALRIEAAVWDEAALLEALGLGTARVPHGSP